MRTLIVIVSFAIAGWAAPVFSQDAAPGAGPDGQYRAARELEQSGPTETTGIGSSTVLGAIPLEKFFAALQGRDLRAREVVLLPGAKIAVHKHDRRPAVVYVLEGEFVEHRSDREAPVIRRQGDTYFETFGVVHWLENISPNPVRVFAVDIAPAAR